MSETAETMGLFTQETIEDVIDHIQQSSREGQLVEMASLASFLETLEASDEESDILEAESPESTENAPDEEEQKRIASLISALMDELNASEKIDLKVLSNDEGTSYLYSGNHMTDQYASILMSLNNKNYLKLIADTVRNESKTYPRPTRISLFTKRPYNLKEGQLLGLLSAMSIDSAYADLKYTEASNGVRFLYSQLHLTERHAKSLAEWEEVTSKEIP